MKKIHIITEEHYTSDGKLRIGGLHNYIDTLAKTLSANGYKVFIHETSIDGKSFIFEPNNLLSIVGYSIKGSFKKRCLKLEQLVKNSKDYSDDDLVIWATDYMALYNHFKNAIAIQHGIAWDVPKQMNSLKRYIRLLLLTKRKVKILSKVRGMICVDYNYLNWIKANFGDTSLIEKIKIITNYANIENQLSLTKPTDTINICFSRRFEDYRGAKVMVEAVKDLSSTELFDKLFFYFAGDGPRKEYIQKELGNFKNVSITNYNPADTYLFHSKMNIAVIPTIGSEGTSLSALEAMATKCAVIVTGTGGLSNIVIDGYSGLIIQPNHIELSKAILKIANDKLLMEELANNGYLEVKKSFSKEKWEHLWIEYIKEYLN